MIFDDLVQQILASYFLCGKPTLNIINWTAANRINAPVPAGNLR